MCTGNKFIVTTILLTGFFTCSFAQDRASATVAATIVSPIGVSNNADTSAGNVGANNGSVVLIPVLDYSTDYVKLSNPGGTVVSAAYAIKDQGAYTYSITLPTTVYNGMNSLTVTYFTSTIAAKGSDFKSSEKLNIGVNLKETGNKTGGITIPITVNYN
jgi:hypothetical protein